MPNLKHAELIEGTVFMAAAVRRRLHRILIGWLDRSISATPGLDGGAQSSIGLDDINQPQPDAYLILPAKMGSRVIEQEDGSLEGAFRSGSRNLGVNREHRPPPCWQNKRRLLRYPTLNKRHPH